MYYNMIHSRPIERDGEIVQVIFEEDTWYRTDMQQLIDLGNSYGELGFMIGFADAIDDTIMMILYHEEMGWRVCQTSSNR